MRNRLKIGRRNAFTLLELLVVIAIIAILLTLLIPSINSAIARAQQVKCASNMRTFGQAWAAYASDNNGLLVSAATGGSRAWVDANPSMAFNTAQLRQGVQRGALWPYVNDLSVYRCPGASGILKDYVWNYSFSGPVGCLGSGHIQWRRIGEIQFPGETLLMVEDFDWRGYNMGSWIYQHNSWYHWIDYLPGNHMGGDNFLFCDGRVEYYRYQDPNTLSVYDIRHFYRADPTGNNPDMDWIGKRYKSRLFYEHSGRLKEQYINNPPWRR